MRIAITGAAGFIGSNLTDALLHQGNEVVGIDNFSTGQKEFLKSAKEKKGFRLAEGDLLDQAFLDKNLAGIDYVFHLAANADVRFGLEHPRRDMEQNAIATQNVLESMRKNKVLALAFSSTGSIYGEHEQFPTPENASFPRQTSLYGASKLAAEGLISAYCEGFGMRAHVYRFVSIMGPRYSHGHVFDFIRKLRADPSKLEILGDGKQRKSYLHVKDCVSALTQRMNAGAKGFEVYNLGTDEFVEVEKSAEIICSTMGVKPKFQFSGGARGWIGDSPFIFLDCKKIRGTGWAPSHTIAESVKDTTKYLLENSWLLENRT
jgi:UDP-glucose 4-epimerase